MNVVSFGGGTNSTAMIVGMYLHKNQDTKAADGGSAGGMHQNDLQ